MLVESCFRYWMLLSQGTGGGGGGVMHRPFGRDIYLGWDTAPSLGG